MKEKLKECLSIHKEAIWIKTGQEKETIPAIINTLLDEDIEEIYTWSVIKGVEKIKVGIEYGYKKEPLESDTVCPLDVLKNSLNSGSSSTAIACLHCSLALSLP